MVASYSLRVGVLMRGSSLMRAVTSSCSRSARCRPRSSPALGLRRVISWISVSPRLIGWSRVTTLSAVGFLAMGHLGGMG
ncbi:hypothetical protein D9M68_972900 [compost metagenome]